MNLLFIGIQGSGKGTQAHLLVDNYDYKLVEMGQEFRNLQNDGSELGNKLKSILSSGNQVGEDLGKEIMQNVFAKNKDEKNIIYDGFLRNEWNKKVIEENLDDFKIVFFNLPVEEAKKRLIGRMYDPLTGETFTAGTLTNPKTGTELVKRADDEEDAIKKRIDLFVELTLPVLEEYKGKNNYIEINANQKIEEVYAELINKLGL